MQKKIKNIIRNSINVKESIYSNDNLLKNIEDIVELIFNCYKNGGKVLLCGNGGSAADAQHIAAELSGRFYIDRPALYAEALHTNTSYVTSVSNDYSFDIIYSRLVQSMGMENDILIGISTSGDSTNIIKAFETARGRGMSTIAFTGISGGKIKELSDYIINIPSIDTPRIQESHIMIGHIICELVEEKIFK